MGHQARQAHQEDVPTPRIDTQNVFLCRESCGQSLYNPGLPGGRYDTVAPLDPDQRVEPVRLAPGEPAPQLVGVQLVGVGEVPLGGVTAGSVVCCFAGRG